MSSDAFTTLGREKFVSLTTFRRSGDAVSTPVWIAQDGDALVVTTTEQTGKVKRHHGFTSHLMSSRPSSKRRKLRRPAIMFEGHARNMRKLMGVSGIRG